MEVCDPTEMRKNLEVVVAFKKAGVDFVPIPVTSKADKVQLIALMESKFKELEKDAR